MYVVSNSKKNKTPIPLKRKTAKHTKTRLENAGAHLKLAHLSCFFQTSSLGFQGDQNHRTPIMGPEERHKSKKHQKSSKRNKCTTENYPKNHCKTQKHHQNHHRKKQNSPETLHKHPKTRPANPPANRSPWKSYPL